MTTEGVQTIRLRKIKQDKIHSKDTNEKHPNKNKVQEAARLLTLSQLVGVLAMIFGGCCANVIALENIVADHPSSGKLVTFVQFLLVSLDGFWHFYNPKARFLISPPIIPLSRWVGPVLIFFSTSVLNNMVWAYDISVPIHLIFRSSGTITTMLTGWLLLGEKYSIRKIMSVVILTLGVIVSTWSKSDELVASTTDTRNFFTGVALLVIATILSSLQGVVQEQTYAKYGKHWRETLFYTHLFSLALFVPIGHELKTQFYTLAAGPMVDIGQWSISKPLIFLALNVSTQYLCVRGVNKLAAHTNALTVVIVLNIRKFVSLLLSTIIFGHQMSPRDALGAIMVFGAAVLYST